jgi:catechol 2,3-dioxygenase-like lactoylglutathione lyase family enzyme
MERHAPSSRAIILAMAKLTGALIIAANLVATLSLSAQAGTESLELTSHHATASVADLNRAIKWYQEKLGFKVVTRRKLDTNTEMAWMATPDYRIDLLQRKGSSKASPPKDHLMAQGWAHIVFSVRDADRTYAILKARGVELPEPLATDDVFHAKYTHFPDSEGNWLAIYQELARPGGK